MVEYEKLTDDEIIRLAAERDQLTEEARFALDAELNRRRIGIDEIKVFEAALRADREEEEKVKRSNLFRGTNKQFYGKGRYTCNEDHRIEEFDTTLWFVVFFFPLVPLGSYRIRRRLRPRWNILASDTIHVVQRLPTNWEQILLTWITALGVLLLLWFGLNWIAYPRS